MWGFLKKGGNIDTARFLLLILTLCFSVDAFCAAGAASSTVTLGAVATHVKTAVSNISTILMDVATVSGAGFVFASFFKFHQHKLNPTQVPLSNGVTLLLVGAGLCIFPHLIETSTQTVFGTSVDKAGSTAISSILVSGGGST
jgi:intracellular multiplication protein IcmD